MNKTLKKTLSIILAILMIVTTVPFAFAADVVKSGNCGANGGNVKWTLDSDGTLTISGTGDMATYANLAKRPWYDYTSDIKKIIIEDGVTSIADYTAYGCFYATSISIGKDVKSIGPSYTTFYCRDLETITVSEDNEYYKAVDNVLFSKDGKELLKVACKALSGTYNVPDGVVKIHKQAFDICKNIEKVVLPDSVEEIGEYAFYQCKSLKILDIGMAKISSVGNGVFEWIEHPVEVIVDKDNEYVSVVNGSLFSKIDGTLFYACVTDNKCVVPYGVKIIPEYTIDVEDGSVVVPDTVETIERDGINAFDSVVHYLGTESQFQEIYEGDMSDFGFEWQGISFHYCVQQSNIPASCTDDGVTEWYCSTCDETIKYVTGYAFGHDIVEVEAQAPTCTEIGWDAYEYCTACDYSTYVELPAITHIDANCDYKCDYNCGYVYETLDFSDAKVLSTNNGYLYIDGEKISVVYNTFDEPIQKIPGGKYILEGDMNSSGAYASMLSDAVSINLNGYTWDFGKKYLSLYVALSIYDTSIGETGKMTSSFQRTVDLRDGSELNLYSGTVENNSENDYSYSLQALTGTANLYGGKLKSNKYAINCNLRNPEIINLVGTVLESGEGYGQLRTPVTLYDDEIPEIVIDVSDYNGIDLTLQLDFYEYTDYVGKYTLIKGVENAEEAEKYKIKINYPEYQPDVYVEEIGYDEATGEIYLYTATNAFTQQPSVENDYTVDFNNHDVSFQWCEVEENHIGKYTAEEFTPLFSYDFKAGDILKVSTDSELRHLVIEAGNEYIDLLENEKTATITFDADTTVDLFVAIVNADNPVEVNFTVFKEAKLDGETEKTLQKVECGKSYYCKATVGENVYLSDVVTVGHNIVSVDAKAPTCTQVGNEAYEYCTACDYTTYVELPADPDAHTDADGDYICDHGCGAEVVTLGGNVYPVDGDITNTGIHIGAFAAFDNCYKAGDGYILIKGEGNDDTVMTLYNATIDVRGTGHKDAIRVDGEDIEIRFFGENNIFADEEAYTTAIGSNRHSQTFIGADDAVLNLYGNVAVSDINIESGTVNVYGADVNDIESVYVEGYLVISDGAVLNIISGDNGQGFNCGIIAQKEIVAEGEFNAIALTGVETDNELIYNLTAIGNAVLGADTYSPYYGMEIPEDMNVEVNFIVPEGASVTVPEGITLNLDSMTNVDIDGELIVYGTLICTHTGGENTCDAPAVCDICGTEYGNIDADNHKDTLVQVDAKAPTCTEIGWDAYEYCTACTYTTYVEKETLKHSFTKYEVTEEAKCGVAGKEVAACDNGCGATDEKAIAALTHKDADGDYKCDNGCGHEFEKPAEPDTPDEPSDDACDHLCHKGGFMGFIWKIVKFFSKLFKLNPVCECGAAHY